MIEILISLLCLILFLLFALRTPLKIAFRQLTSGKSPDSDEQFRKLVEREKQRMQEEAGAAQSQDPDTTSESD